MIRRDRLTRLGACLLGCLLPSVAAAQGDGWDGRVRVSVAGGIQSGSNTLAQSFSVQQNLEPAPITVSIDAKRATLFDGGIVVRVAGQFGVGVSASYATHDANANITALVPHPLFFNQPRTVTGTTPVSRTEVAAHIDGVYIVPAGAVDLLLSGGPSVFSIDQTLVTDIAYTDAYPYDTATFTSATSAPAKKTAIGYHVGADITWKASSHVGIGVMVRYARATVTLSPASGNTVQDNAGGGQAAAGLRFGF